MRRLLIPVFAMLALFAAACGDSDGEDTAATTSTTDPTTTSESTTTTAPDDAWTTCENPEGFSVAYPDDWHTNDGEVVGECSYFDPEPFEVPDATDVRFAAISAYVEDVDYAEAAVPEDDEDSRAVTAVDGHQAVRIVGPAGELYEGETVTRYYIDFSASGADDDGTLIIDTLSTDDAVVEVLDQMVKTIEIDSADASADQVVARYGGGGTPFAAVMSQDGGDPCVTAPVEGESTTECFTVPSPDALRFADYSGDLFEAFGGVTGSDVFRVEAVLNNGSFEYLPVAPSDDEVRGWMIPVAAEEVIQLNWYDIDGEALGAREFDAEDGPEPVAAFAKLPQETDDFPASGETSLLTDVRVSGHDGFDRIVFEFDGDAFSRRLESVEEVRATSGEEVEVDGDRTYQLTMTPASGVDLSGEEPVVTYDGPERIDPSTTTVVDELVAAEDFEASMTWALGVDASSEVAVAFLENPTRLVVDIQAG